MRGWASSTTSPRRSSCPDALGAGRAVASGGRRASRDHRPPRGEAARTVRDPSSGPVPRSTPVRDRRGGPRSARVRRAPGPVVDPLPRHATSVPSRPPSAPGAWARGRRRPRGAVAPPPAPAPDTPPIVIAGGGRDPVAPLAAARASHPRARRGHRVRAADVRVSRDLSDAQRRSRGAAQARTGRVPGQGRQGDRRRHHADPAPPAGVRASPESFRAWEKVLIWVALGAGSPSPTARSPTCCCAHREQLPERRAAHLRAPSTSV